MSEERLEQLLMDALDLLEQNVPADEILARYPGEAEELRPFLATAVQLSALLGEPDTLPSPQAQVQSKEAFLAAADSLETSAARRSAAVVSPWGWLQRFLAPVMALLLILFLAGATIVTAAGSSLPGDALYGTKRLVEQVRLSVAANPEALQQQYRQERIREAEQLLNIGRSAAVTISGEIQAVQDGRLVVGGLVVNLRGNTTVEGMPFVGRQAVVEGHTEDGVLFADRIVVDEQSGPPIPTPTPTNTATPLPTVTTEPTTTPLPSATTTSLPSPTNTLQPTDIPPTAVPPTAVPSTQPPPPPPPDDNGNDNGNDNDDNANDNDENRNVNGNNNGNTNDDDNANDNDDDSDNGGNGSSGNDDDDGGGNENDNDDDGGSNDNNDDDESDDNDNGG